MEVVMGQSQSTAQAGSAKAGLTTACPSCGTKYQIKRAAIGHEATCRKCGNPFVMAVYATTPPGSMPTAVSALESHDLTRLTLEKGTQNDWARIRRNRARLITSGIVLVLIAVMVFHNLFYVRTGVLVLTEKMVPRVHLVEYGWPVVAVRVIHTRFAKPANDLDPASLAQMLANQLRDPDISEMASKMALPGDMRMSDQGVVTFTDGSTTQVVPHAVVADLSLQLIVLFAIGYLAWRLSSNHTWKRERAQKLNDQACIVVESDREMAKRNLYGAAKEDETWGVPWKNLAVLCSAEGKADEAAKYHDAARVRGA
jgi:ribosomal protein L37AE/L43A